MRPLVAGTASDAGRVRSSNQDHALVTDNLVAVADGMGGHVGGEVAAQTAVDALQAAFAGEPTATGLIAAAGRANREIFERSARDPALRGMGTTLTAAALVPGEDEGSEKLALVNVGDSRAYLLSTSGDLVRLTDDHSLVEEMVRRGELDRSAAATHPHRHILTRALGIDRGVDVDAWELDLATASRLLLCSDGLTNECSDSEIAEILSAGESPQATAEALVRRALEHGGSDNVTVVVVDLEPEPFVATAGDHAAGEATRDAPGSPPESALADDSAGLESVDPSAWASQAAEATAAANAAGPAASVASPVAVPIHSPRQFAPRPPTVPARADLLHAAPRPPRRRADRVMSLRVLVFLLLLVGTLGGTVGAVVWYVRSSWYVGIEQGHVAIFEGRPGGFLWFHPSVYELSTLESAQVFTPLLPALNAGMLEPSLDTARQVVANLAAKHTYLALTPGDTSAAASALPPGVGTAAYVPTTTLAPASTTTTSPPVKTKKKKG